MKAALLVALAAAQHAHAAAPAGAKNVLFLVSDDMRPSIGGHFALPEAHTPNLERLMDQGITFARAYIQYSYCSPSRNSFMSGRRPDATKAWSFVNHFREEAVGAEWDSLPEHFRKKGYLVTGAGKLFHPGSPPNFDNASATGGAFAWSAYGPEGEAWPYREMGDNVTNLCAEECCNATEGNYQPMGDMKYEYYCPYELAPGAGKGSWAEGGYSEAQGLTDQRDAAIVLGRLPAAAANYKKTKQPFFIGLGFHKPHLRWDFPGEYLDKIPPDVPEAVHQAYPADKPDIAWHECAEMSVSFYDTDGNGAPPLQGKYNAKWQSIVRRAYYACISYVDSLIGDAIDALETNGVAEDTVISFIGDHGWNLGEFDIWCKMTNFELGTRVPLIISAPWITASKGERSMALAEAVDLYPTLSELAMGAGQLPTGKAGEFLGGASLAPIFHDIRTKVKNVSLSQFARCWQNNTAGCKPDSEDHNGICGYSNSTSSLAGGHIGPQQACCPGDERNMTVSMNQMSDCHWQHRSAIDFMGYTMRTEEFRYTEWCKWDGAKLRPIWSEQVGLELYDHAKDNGTAADMDLWEGPGMNLAHLPSHAAIVKSLSAQLHTEVAKWWTPNPPNPK